MRLPPLKLFSVTTVVNILYLNHGAITQLNYVSFSKVKYSGVNTRLVCYPPLTLLNYIIIVSPRQKYLRVLQCQYCLFPKKICNVCISHPHFTIIWNAISTTLIPKGVLHFTSPKCFEQVIPLFVVRAFWGGFI